MRTYVIRLVAAIFQMVAVIYINVVPT